jgi:hypothetical protein
MTKKKEKVVVDATRRLDAGEMVAADVVWNMKEDSDIEEYQALTAEINTIDGVCRQALFMYAHINIIGPCLEILFGE